MIQLSTHILFVCRILVWMICPNTRQNFPHFLRFTWTCKLVRDMKMRGALLFLATKAACHNRSKCSCSRHYDVLCIKSCCISFRHRLVEINRVLLAGEWLISMSQGQPETFADRRWSKVMIGCSLDELKGFSFRGVFQGYGRLLWWSMVMGGWS